MSRQSSTTTARAIPDSEPLRSPLCAVRVKSQEHNACAVRSCAVLWAQRGLTIAIMCHNYRDLRLTPNAALKLILNRLSICLLPLSAHYRWLPPHRSISFVHILKAIFWENPYFVFRFGLWFTFNIPFTIGNDLSKNGIKFSVEALEYRVLQLTYLSHQIL